MNPPTNPVVLRLLTFSTVMLVIAATVGAPASAAEPTNNSIKSPTEVTAIPSTFAQDTSEATPSASDGKCVEGASVWYRYKPAATKTARVVTFGSDFDTRLAVFSGPVKNRQLVACDDDTRFSTASAAAVRFVAGKVYWIAVSACCRERAPGGESVLTLYWPRLAGVAVTFDTAAAGSVSGRLYMSGTIACQTPAAGIVRVFVSQRLSGGGIARGWGFEHVSSCTSAPSGWEMTINSNTGWAFEEGMVAVEAEAVASDGFQRVTEVQSIIIAVTSDPI